MAVRKHPTMGDGYWIIDYYPSGRKGKRVRQTFCGTYDGAVELEMDLRRQPSDIDTYVAPVVKDIVPYWLESYRDQVAEKTYRRALGCLQNWLPYFGAFLPAAISKKVINQYKHARLHDIANAAAVERGREPRYISKRTVNKELSSLSSLLRWASDNGYCPDLPLQIKGFSARQLHNTAPKILTPRQITAMYKATEEKYKLVFLLMADMGLRVAEATHIEAEWVDEYRETIAVIGKGRRERILPWTTNRIAENLTRALEKNVTGYLTPNPKTELPFVDVRKPINRAAEHIKLKRKINPHLLRHTCLTNLAEQGMSPHALQQFAGHRSIDTTNKIYTHIRSDYVGTEVRKIRSGGGLEL